MNVIQIAGHLGADPETRFTPNGQKVTTFNVATKIRKGGNETTVWYRITVWGDRFDKMLVHFKKGSAIIVVGELGEPRIWTDKEGRPQASLDVTADIIRFSPFGKTERAGQEQGSQTSYSNQVSQTQPPQQGTMDSSFGGGFQYAGNQSQKHTDPEDDMPF
jgi:single-strand DNA-binding protein